MKIQRANGLLLTFWLLLLFILMYILATDLHHFEQAEIRNQDVKQVASEVFKLVVLTNETLLLRTPRSSQQWQQSYQELGEKIERYSDSLNLQSDKRWVALQRYYQELGDSYYSVTKELSRDNISSPESTSDFHQGQFIHLLGKMTGIDREAMQIRDESLAEIQLLAAKIKQRIITAAIVAIILLLLTSFYIWRSIVKPLTIISTWLHLRTDKATTEALRMPLHNEIGEMVDALNEMDQKQQHSQQELTRLNYKLSEEVVDATDQYNRSVYLHKQILNSSSELMALVDPNFCYLMANNAYVDFFNTEEAKILQQPIVNQIGASTFAEIVRPQLQQALAGKIVNSHLRLINTAREERYFDVVYTPYQSDGKNKVHGVVIMLHDNTESQLLRQQTQRQEQLLVQQAKLAAMGEMIGAIAHQWRQPLSAIGANLINIEESYEDNELTEAYLHRNLDSAEKNLAFMSKTIDDFRNFFKPSSSKMRFSVIESVSDAISIVHAQMKDHAIALLMQIEHNGLTKYLEFDRESIASIADQPIVSGYANEFAQVLVNLFGNARDAIEAAIAANQLPAASGKICITIETKKNSVYIHITDNGIGIDAEKFNRIFEPYYTTKADSGGTGIGLYMSKVIIEEKMSGQLTVVNTTVGAEFVIILPLD